MNKKTITVFLLSALILGQGFAINVQAQEANVQIQENSSDYIVQDSWIKDNGGFEYCEIDNFIQSRVPETNEEFTVGTKGRDTYTYDYTATVKEVNMKISFNKRARNFEVVLKNSSGHTVASKSFNNWYAPDGSKGVKKVQLRGKTTIGEKYTIEIINHDSVNIEGTIHVEG